MVAQGNVGIAFLLVIGAGACTTIGACAALFANLATVKFLAAALAVSAGVMLYVSFVEIFMIKGITALEDAGWGENGAYRNGTLLLFGGMLFTYMLDLLVHCLSNLAGPNKELDATGMREINVDDGPSGMKASIPGTDIEKGSVHKGKGDSKTITRSQHGSEPVTRSLHGSENTSTIHAGMPDRSGNLLEDSSVHLAHDPKIAPEAVKTVEQVLNADDHRFGLQKMGLMTALAIGIHNLPEGLATFVAALSDPLNGLAIAIAIALHNLPEGICVALPVYYATGSRVKGIAWALISGLSEPLGGLLGYYVLYGNRMSNAAYGVLFCLVSGMMIYISFDSLIPTACKYDPKNEVTSRGIFFGMFFMAASLMFFLF